jgi:hypothetical protein
VRGDEKLTEDAPDFLPPAMLPPFSPALLPQIESEPAILVSSLRCGGLGRRLACVILNSTCSHKLVIRISPAGHSYLNVPTQERLGRNMDRLEARSKQLLRFKDLKEMESTRPVLSLIEAKLEEAAAGRKKSLRSSLSITETMGGALAERYEGILHRRSGREMVMCRRTLLAVSPTPLWPLSFFLTRQLPVLVSTCQAKTEMMSKGAKIRSMLEKIMAGEGVTREMILHLVSKERKMEEEAMKLCRPNQDMDLLRHIKKQLMSVIEGLSLRTVLNEAPLLAIDRTIAMLHERLGMIQRGGRGNKVCPLLCPLSSAPSPLLPLLCPLSSAFCPFSPSVPSLTFLHSPPLPAFCCYSVAGITSSKRRTPSW